jgi:hypothetical protein
MDKNSWKFGYQKRKEGKISQVVRLTRIKYEASKRIYIIFEDNYAGG